MKWMSRCEEEENRFSSNFPEDRFDPRVYLQVQEAPAPAAPAASSGAALVGKDAAAEPAVQ